MRISGAVALVTGGSRGIGAAVAHMLAKEGATVAIGYRRSESAATQVVDTIVASGGVARAFRADLTDPEEVGRLASEVESQLGPPTILINNAGAILRPGGWNEQDLDSLSKTIDLNLRAPMLLIRKLAPAMIEAGTGAIVNVSSTYGITGAAAVLAYTASKAGVISLTYSMARELGPKGIRVNAVVPGNIDTEMTRDAGSGVIDWSVSTTPLGRLGTVEEIASAVKFLVEHEFMAGHALIVDGGQILNM